jgi:uncharacterized linocin/CFP29 family protein
MSDFLMREEAPLMAEEWARIDETVVGVAKKLLVGRRLISIYGPFGAGLQTVTVDRYHVSEACLHQGKSSECCNGECECKECDCDAVDVASRDILTLPLIHKDFVLHWQDIATSRQFHMPLDLGQVGAASAMVAMKEDKMIFGALLDKAGTKVSAAKADEPGSVFASFVAAAAALAATGNVGPYAAVVSPATYAKLHRPMAAGMGILEIVQVRELASGGLYQTSALKDGQALLISQGAQNLDLALGQDLATAYLGPDKMDHLFRVLETLALRIKRPEAICVIA